jgi:hypothetical protein
MDYMRESDYNSCFNLEISLKAVKFISSLESSLFTNYSNAPDIDATVLTFKFDICNYI